MAAFAQFAFSGPILQVATSTREFGTVDAATGAFTLIGTTAPTSVGLGQSNSGHPFFVDDVSNLHRINPSTAGLTLAGGTGTSLSVAAGFAPGVLFGLDYSNNLYAVNTSTGAASLVGATGIPAIGLQDTFSNALAGDGVNLYYIFELAGSANIASSLYRLNTATGAATLVGLTGAAQVGGAGFGDGALYAFTKSSRQIRSVNLGTGASTLLASYAGQSSGEIWAASQPLPEPATVALVVLGLGLFVLRHVYGVATADRRPPST